MNHNTVKHVMFAWPLFPEFRDLGDFAKITAREYTFYQQFIISGSKNAKIKSSTVSCEC